MYFESCKTTYDYKEAMKEDIREWLEANADFYDYAEEHDNRESFAEWLNDELWIADSVTGNASGSYTFSAYEAAENVGGNLDLLIEAIEEFGDEPEEYKRCLKSPETADVIIRCYLLGEVIEEVINDLTEQGVELWQEEA